MKYKVLQNVTTGLLTGDVLLPNDEDVMLGLLEMAFSELANKAEALHLMTLDKNSDFNRMAQGDYLMRTPELPKSGSDVLDIDHELCFALARIIASYVSREKGGIHKSEAIKLINDYNGKVYELLETVSIDPETGLVDTSDRM